MILIEADLRRPTFSSLLNLDFTSGTESVLIGEAELAQALVPVRFEGTSLRVLAAQYSSSSMPDRLSPVIAAKLIDDAKALADFVVIDSPPLTAVIDALPLAQFADEVLIVARLGRSKISKIVELTELLAQFGAGPSGIVLVGEHSRRLAGGYYYASAHDFEEYRRSSSRRTPVRATSEPLEPIQEPPG